MAGPCSRDVLAERVHITFGVGATIGSVPPHVGVNCISNWTFNDITFTNPIKGASGRERARVCTHITQIFVVVSTDVTATDSHGNHGCSHCRPVFLPSPSCLSLSVPRPPVRLGYQAAGLYLKPNPGTVGTGIISQITYSNVYGNNTIWTSIDANTQQQKQPGNGSDTGCSFFFPLFNTTCPLQPRVPIVDLHLSNVVFENSLLSLNTIRCANATEGAGIAGWQPCAGWSELIS